MILSRSPWKSSEDLRRLTRLFSRNSAWELAIVANPFFNLFRKEGEELQERWKSASPPFFFFFPVSAISFNSRNHLVAMLWRRHWQEHLKKGGDFPEMGDHVTLREDRHVENLRGPISVFGDFHAFFFFSSTIEPPSFLRYFLFEKFPF